MTIGASRHIGHSVYRFNLRCQELTNSFAIQLITHMQLIVKHFKYHIFKSICTFVITFRISHFQIHMHFCNNVSIYTHSIYSLQSSFWKLLHLLKFLDLNTVDSYIFFHVYLPLRVQIRNFYLHVEMGCLPKQNRYLFLKLYQMTPKSLEKRELFASG